MNTRQRTIAGIGVVLLIVLLIVGGLLVANHFASRANTASAEKMAQSVATASTDAEVCSHVDPKPTLFAPGGDWNTPAVAAIALWASPYVRDAYSAAAEAQIPFQATPDEMQTAIAKWNHLSAVCAQVRANSGH